MNEEFIEGFCSENELTPIDIVSDITGITIEELRKSCKVTTIDVDSTITT